MCVVLTRHKKRCHQRAPFSKHHRGGHIVMSADQCRSVQMSADECRRVEKTAAGIPAQGLAAEAHVDVPNDKYSQITSSSFIRRMQLSA